MSVAHNRIYIFFWEKNTSFTYANFNHD